jgi:hypothetical protein
MHVRRFLFALFALLTLPPFIAAQAKASGTIPSTAGSSCVSINVDAQATVGIAVTGTWTGTLQPKISVQGQTANTQVTPSTSTTPAATITANGVYRASVAGGSTFLLCGNTVATGTANVFLNATTATAGSASGGAPLGNALTMNNSGTGAASGATFDGSAAVTASYNTFGAAPTASPTFTGTQTNAPTMKFANATALQPTSGGLITWNLTSNSFTMNDTTGASITVSAGSPSMTGTVSGGGTFLSGGGAGVTVSDYVVQPGAIFNGTTFGASGCSVASLVGGSTTGSYASGTSGTCTVVITMGGGLTAGTGWVCSTWDLTTPADVQKQIARTATTATISGTTVSGDVIIFHCDGY